jgi:hypothetical protein
MIIIGCDFHPSFQQIAMLDTETGATEGPENIIRPYYASFFSPWKNQWTPYLSARCP